MDKEELKPLRAGVCVWDLKLAGIKPAAPIAISFYLYHYNVVVIVVSISVSYDNLEDAFAAAGLSPSVKRRCLICSSQPGMFLRSHSRVMHECSISSSRE